MNIYEIEKEAKDKGFNSLRFIMINKQGRKFEGKFLDAYFGMILILEVSDGFIMLKDLIDYDMEFIPLHA